MKHGSLFSGIGGFDLASEWMGWDNVFHCEWNEFGQKVLKYYWPNAISYGDITKTDFTKHRGEIDILTGGFPCQPFSLAGQRKGTEDERHLWPEMLRSIREIKPSWVLGENVFGIVNWDGGLVFDQVQTDLENEGYEVIPYIIPACGVNAPHRRDRVWFIAHSINFGNRIGMRNNGSREKKDRGKGRTEKSEFRTESIKGVTPNTDGNGKRLLCRSESEQGQEAHSFNSDISGHESIADTESKRLQGYNERSGCSLDRINERVQSGTEDKQFIRNISGLGLEGGIQTRKHGKQNGESKEIREISKYIYDNRSGIQFEYFPTQPPICGRDDGFSSKLDGITFPKWRNESIKGYGNAIVPQVAYQIFKAIEKFIELDLHTS